MKGQGLSKIIELILNLNLLHFEVEFFYQNLLNSFDIPKQWFNLLNLFDSLIL